MVWALRAARGTGPLRSEPALHRPLTRGRLPGAGPFPAEQAPAALAVQVPAAARRRADVPGSPPGSAGRSPLQAVPLAAPAGPVCRPPSAPVLALPGHDQPSGRPVISVPTSAVPRPQAPSRGSSRAGSFPEGRTFQKVTGAGGCALPLCWEVGCRPPGVFVTPPAVRTGMRAPATVFGEPGVRGQRPEALMVGPFWPYNPSPH